MVKECEFLYTIDPSLVSLQISKFNNISHIQSFFEYNIVKNNLKHKISCIVFRHLLEHVEKPRKFLQDAVKLLENDGIIYVEVPNTNEFVENGRFYEIFNDHFGYFQKETLINIFNDIDCKYIDSISLYNNQHIGLFFKKQKDMSFNKDNPILFNKNFNNIMSNNIKKINEEISIFNSIALYGAGAHGNSIITYLSYENRLRIKCCYDLDTRKQGKYLQNSNIIIKNPCTQNYCDIECILFASPLYEEEIYNYLVDGGFNGKIIKTLNLN